MRRAARRDESEPAVIAELKAMGAFVQTLSGRGVPDLLVFYRGTHLLIEVIGEQKAKKYVKTGGLTPDQVIWHSWWPGEVHIVRDPSEVARVLKEGS